MENIEQKKTSFFDRKFRITEKGSSIKTEIIAGLTTFLAMAYILVVNSGMFSALEGVSFDAMYVTTALSAVIGTVLIGLMANLPLAQAPGMGLNAFFVYTVCFTLGFTYANALVFVLLDGLIFVNGDEMLMSGDFVRVKVTGANEYDLIGEVYDESAE